MPKNGGEGDGNSGGGNDPVTREELERQAKRAVEEGRAIEKIAALLEDNQSLREDRRDLRSKVERVPDPILNGDEESVEVLTGEDLEQFRRFREMEMDPEEVQAEIESGREAREKLSDMERKDRIRSAADAHGYKFDPLRKLAESDGLEIEVREQEEGDETRQVAFVRPSGEEEADPEPLTEYAEREWGDFQPALTAEEGGSGEGTEWPEQSGGPGPAETEVTTEDVVEEKRGDYPAL